jgi:hypothetical protein
VSGLISVITCTIDGDREASVVSNALKTLPNCSIAFRCSELISLNNYLQSQPNLPGRIIIFHDFSSIQIEKFPFLHRDEPPILIDISTLDLTDSELLATTIAQLTRESVMSESAQRSIERDHRFILFTGSSGAPGITTIAANVIWELSQQRFVRACERSEDLLELPWLITGSKTMLHVPGKIEFHGGYKPDQDSHDDRLIVMDCGTTLSIQATKTDRRRQGREFIDSLHRAGTIVYVAQPDERHLHQFRALCDGLREINFRGDFLLVMNKFTEGKENRLLLRSMNVNALTSETLIIPRDLRAVERSRQRSLPLAVLEPRSRIRRAIATLANTLLEKSEPLSVPSPHVTRSASRRRLNSYGEREGASR